MEELFSAVLVILAIAFVGVIVALVLVLAFPNLFSNKPKQTDNKELNGTVYENNAPDDLSDEESFDIEESSVMEEEANKCEACGAYTTTSKDAFCRSCFMKRKTIFIVLTLVVSVAIAYIANLGSFYIGQSVYDAGNISDTDLYPLLQMCYYLIAIILIIPYKIAMMKYLRSGWAFCPSVLIFAFAYKMPLKKEKIESKSGIERAGMKE